ncbi:MAG: integrin alpha, partial [Alphaproteobacteria bacterium]|nr:integrin alpha [Alphaproteobacteria bacterium]
IKLVDPTKNNAGDAVYVLFGQTPDDTDGNIDAQTLVTNGANIPGVFFNFAAPGGTIDLTAELSESYRTTLTSEGKEAGDTLHIGSVENVGDFDGDGYDDFAVVLEITDPKEDTGNRGVYAYLYYGGANYDFSEPSNDVTLFLRRPPTGVSLSETDNDPLNLSFRAVYRGGDLNQDGQEELIVAGRSSMFVIFGTDELKDASNIALNVGFAPSGFGFLYGATATVTTFTFNNELKTESYFDRLVDVQGGFDVTGDGIDDLVLLYESPTYSQALAFRDSFPDETAVSYSAYAWVLPGDNTDDGIEGIDHFLYEAQHAFDDGLSSIALQTGIETKIGLNNDGMTKIVFASAPITTNEPNTTDNVFTGTPIGFSSFNPKLALGNVNGDDHADLVLSYQSPLTPTVETAFVVFGKTTIGRTPPDNGGKYGASTIFAESLDIDEGVILHAEDATDRFGYALAVGDIDGDSYDDILIGAPYHDSDVPTDNAGVLTNNGRVYAIYGRESLASEIRITQHADGTTLTQGVFITELLQTEEDGLPAHVDLGFVIDGFSLSDQTANASESQVGTSLALVDQLGDGSRSVLVASKEGSLTNGIVQFIKGGDFRLTARNSLNPDGTQADAYVVSKKDNPLQQDTLRGSAEREIFTEIESPVTEVYAGAGNDAIVFDAPFSGANGEETGTPLLVIAGGGGVDSIRRTEGQFNLDLSNTSKVFRSLEVIDLVATDDPNVGGATLQGLTPAQVHQIVSNEGALGIEGKRVLLILGDDNDNVTDLGGNGWTQRANDVALHDLYTEAFNATYRTSLQLPSQIDSANDVNDVRIVHQINPITLAKADAGLLSIPLNQYFVAPNGQILTFALEADT